MIRRRGHCPASVSYTHLDVYKRQGQGGEPGQSAPMTQQQSDELVADLKKAAKDAGGTAAPTNQTTSGLANPGKLKNAKAQKKVTGEKAAPHDQAEQAPGASTVSYTHLDVYKRQTSCCAAIRLSARLPAPALWLPA